MIFLINCQTGDMRLPCLFSWLHSLSPGILVVPFRVGIATKGLYPCNITWTPRVFVRWLVYSLWNLEGALGLVHPWSPPQSSVFGLSADPVWYTEHLAAGGNSQLSLCYVHRRKCEFYLTAKALVHSFFGPWEPVIWLWAYFYHSCHLPELVRSQGWS